MATMEMTQKEFKAMLKQRFIFCYSCDMMNWLRPHNIRYLCKVVHEITKNPFWLYDRSDEIEGQLRTYTEKFQTDEARETILDVASF